MHEVVAFLFIQTSDGPHISESERYSVEVIGPKIYKIVLHYGFMDLPNVPLALTGIKLEDYVIDPQKVTFFLGREHIMATERKGMRIWREHLFALKSRNAQPVTKFIQLPSHRVVEIGTIVEI
jgi:KUP system potassium uptake protein